MFSQKIIISTFIVEFFLGSKNDLSDESKTRNGIDSNKIREDCDNINSMPYDVFVDGISSSGCAKILVISLRNIEGQVNELYTLYENTKNSQIKGKKQIQSVIESLHFRERTL